MIQKQLNMQKLFLKCSGQKTETPNINQWVYIKNQDK